MKITWTNRKFSFERIQIMIFAFVACIVMDLLYGEEYHVSGTITRQVGDYALRGAEITILNSVSQDTIAAGIFTDNEGKYDVTFDASVTHVNDNSASLASDNYWVSAIHPNPASPNSSRPMTVQYTAPDNSQSRPVIELFDILGRRVSAKQKLSSGIYFYRLKLDDGLFSRQRKFILLSSGYLNFELKRITTNSSTSSLEKTSSTDVLFIVQKSGYAILEIQKSLESGITNIFDFSLEALSVSKLIGPEGGAIVMPDDLVELTIPAGALDQATEIHIKTSIDTTDDPWLIEDAVFKFEPEGIQFAQPVQLTIKYQGENIPTGAPDSSLKIYVLDDTTWKQVEGSRSIPSENTVVATIHGFSEFGAHVYSPHIYASLGKGQIIPGSGAPLALYDMVTISRMDFAENDTVYEETEKIIKSIDNLNPIECLDDYFGCEACFGSSFFKLPLRTYLSDMAEIRERHSAMFWMDSIDDDKDNIIQFSLKSAPQPVLVPGEVSFKDVLCTVDLGLVEPSLQEERRFSFVIVNPARVAFNLYITAVYFADVTDLTGGSPVTSYSSGSASYMLLSCNEPYEQGTVKPLFNAFATIFDSVQGGSNSYKNENLSDSVYQVWIEAQLSTFAQANVNDEEGTIGYGETVYNEAKFGAAIEILLLPLNTD